MKNVIAMALLALLGAAGCTPAQPEKETLLIYSPHGKDDATDEPHYVRGG